MYVYVGRVYLSESTPDIERVAAAIAWINIINKCGARGITIQDSRHIHCGSEND